MPAAEQSTRVKWVEVPAEALKGQGLRPYYEGEISNLFDWAENPNGRSEHLMAHRQQMIVDIVQIDANAVHQPSKPGDEVVVVLNGILRLTDDGTGIEQEIHAREAVLIPAGWAGIYRVIPDNGPFLEMAMIPGDYFDEGVAPPPSGKSPRKLEFPTAPGVNELHRNRFSVEVVNCTMAGQWSDITKADEILLVLQGTITLEAEGDKAIIGKDGVVILPAGLTCEAAATADYRALLLRWIG